MHRSCYASFTSKSHISRLQTKSSEKSADLDKGAAPSNPPTLTRSSVVTMNRNACMFCQEVNSKLRLSMVSTLNMSGRILAASKYDQILSVHLASVSDLSAAEGRCHTACYMKLLRKTTKFLIIRFGRGMAFGWIDVCSKRCKRLSQFLIFTPSLSGNNFCINKPLFGEISVLKLLVYMDVSMLRSNKHPFNITYSLLLPPAWCWCPYVDVLKYTK